MWLSPLGLTESQTEPACEWVSLSVCVFARIIQNYFMHLCTNHGFDCLFDLVSVVEKITGKVYVAALVCSCGTRTPFHLTVLPSGMSALPVCTSTSQAGWAVLATFVTSLTVHLCEKVNHLHTLTKTAPPECAAWTPSTLSSVDKCVYWMRSSAESFQVPRGITHSQGTQIQIRQINKRESSAWI